MKKFKDTDVKISMALILLFAVAAFINTDFLFYGYFTVGGWQVISMSVHQINGWFVKKQSVRYRYHITVAGIILLSVTGLLFPPLLMFTAVVMLVAAPCMAIYYTFLCHHELTVSMKRPLDALK
ncbi:MAG: hypothetical protein WAT19_16290 [Ferruginibacter sp.]